MVAGPMTAELQAAVDLEHKCKSMGADLAIDPHCAGLCTIPFLALLPKGLILSQGVAAVPRFRASRFRFARRLRHRMVAS